MNYYVSAVLTVLQGENLTAHDKLSFDLPTITNQEDWEKLMNKSWREAEKFASLVETMDENKLEEIFSFEKYGNYFRNITGIIEHNHYHLGQIVLLKKIIHQ